MKTILKFSMAFVAFVLFAGCSEDGVDGKDGINGEQGPQGPTGNANVVIKQVTLDNASYSNSSYGMETTSGSYIGRFSKKARISDAAITADVIDNGIVLVYMKTPTGLGSTTYTWTPLPASILALYSGYSDVWQTKVGAGYIDIHFYFEPNAPDVVLPNINTATVNTRTFKYVIISGNDVAAFKAGELVIDTAFY